MLRFVNIHELHTKTPEAILWVEKGGKCVITKRGKPKALLLPLNEEDIEDLILNSKPMLKEIISSERQAKKKGWKTLAEVRKELGIS